MTRHEEMITRSTEYLEEIFLALEKKYEKVDAEATLIALGTAATRILHEIDDPDGHSLWFLANLAQNLSGNSQFRRDKAEMAKEKEVS